MTIQALNPESVVERMIAELNENPEARRLLLRALLTDEFLTLPDKVERIEEDVSDLKAGQAALQAGQADLKAGQAALQAGQAEMRGQIAELQAGQAELQVGQARTQGQIAELQAGQAELQAGQDEMREDIDLLKSGQSRMEGQIGNLRGDSYERRMIRYIVQTALRSWDMEDVDVLIGDRPDRVAELATKVRNAARRGLITREQGDELLWADVVVSGARESDQSPIHAVAEISITIGESDIIRAAERAATLSAVMSEPAMGVVIGSRISEPDRRRAERSDVLVTIIRE